jgi:hypothetical protein
VDGDPGGKSQTAHFEVTSSIVAAVLGRPIGGMYRLTFPRKLTAPAGHFSVLSVYISHGVATAPGRQELASGVLSGIPAQFGPASAKGLSNWRAIVVGLRYSVKVVSFKKIIQSSRLASLIN